MTENLPSLMPAHGQAITVLQIMLDDRFYERAKQIASLLSKSEGFVPPHLLGKPEACFAVVTRSLTWRLDPFAVAQSTYSTPGGKVGYEGKLCQAIIENSGQIEGGVEYEPYGDWSKVQGKFRIETSQKGNKYAVASYTTEDEKGLGVYARAQVKGEKKAREFKIDLLQAYPRNSTLWATDPLTQLRYRAVRGLGNSAMPGIFMGVPIEGDDTEYSAPIKDITPEVTPQASSINEKLKANTAVIDGAIVTEDGEIIGEATVSKNATVQTGNNPPPVESKPAEKPAPTPKPRAFGVYDSNGEQYIGGDLEMCAQEVCVQLESMKPAEREGYITHNAEVIEAAACDFSPFCKRLTQLIKTQK